MLTHTSSLKLKVINDKPSWIWKWDLENGQVDELWWKQRQVDLHKRHVEDEQCYKWHVSEQNDNRFGCISYVYGRHHYKRSEWHFDYHVGE